MQQQQPSRGGAAKGRIARRAPWRPFRQLQQKERRVCIAVMEACSNGHILDVILSTGHTHDHAEAVCLVNMYARWTKKSDIRVDIDRCCGEVK